ncbi:MULTISPECIES: AAA family ATPase [Bradyrhizobium]|uniref:Succinoglycan biosynthesis transport protein ExoP n=2 Tax=Bradyrhizobium TaxID=374 RepID=A0ABY0PI76_9BRAD|nr:MULTISPECIES: AAA family ATPase [Bradyrhizobium]SDI38607.1 succinoglycan biosynthesis transport protein ExoP [Bradyrhizobium ottawaense]SED58196.1 succinoglycan biosynthesis transport protein ExoP [Bradyrhizobium lablabi]
MDARTSELPLETEHDYSDGSEFSQRSSARPSIGVTDILETLRRNWRFPLYGFLIGLALAVVYFVTVPNPYKSSARLLVDRSVSRYLQNNKIVDQPTFDEPEIGSQTFVVSSDSVVIPVVRSLGLTHDSEFVGQPKMGGARISDYLGDLKKAVGNMLGMSVAPPADPEAALERAAVEAIGKRLTVAREDIANVINVAFESEDKNKAAKIANAIADSYITTTLDAKLKSTRVASQWLQDRLVELKKQAADADRALQDFRGANNLKSGGGGQGGMDQRANLEIQLANAQIATAEAKSRLDRIQQSSGSGITAIVGTDALLNPARSGMINFALNNSDLVKLRSQYREVAARAADVEGKVGSKHEVAIKLRRQAEELQSAISSEELRIADSYSIEYQVAKARETELAATVANLSGGTKAGSELRELESSAETLHKLYDGTLQKYKEINTIETETMPVQSARVITRAVPALSKNSKKGWAVLAGSMMLGLFLGAGAAVGREWVADVFRTPRAVEQVTDNKCVVLPLVEATSTPMEELVLDAPYSRFTEALRNVKAQIDTNRSVHGAKVIGIVSSLPKEGKTTVGANLAALMIAASGARTLVIDSDFHVRRLSATLAPDAREGLLEALENPTRLPWLVSRRQRSGLHVLPCVSPARIPNSAELLGSPMMAQLLAVARKSYDYIIIEIAPVMSVVDVKMIECFVDQFVFVVEWGETKRDLVLDALTEAEVVRDRLACIILNKADPVAIQKIESYKGIKPGDYYQS